MNRKKRQFVGALARHSIWHCGWFWKQFYCRTCPIYVAQSVEPKVFTGFIGNPFVSIPRTWIQLLIEPLKITLHTLRLERLKYGILVVFFPFAKGPALGMSELAQLGGDVCRSRGRPHNDASNQMRRNCVRGVVTRNICDVCRRCNWSDNGPNCALLMACLQVIPPFYVDELCAGRPVTNVYRL